MKSHSHQYVFPIYKVCLASRDRFLTAIDPIEGDIFWPTEEVVPDSCCLMNADQGDNIILATLGVRFVAYDFDSETFCGIQMTYAQ